MLFLSSCVFPIDFFDSSTLPTSEETSQTTTLPTTTSEEPSTTFEPTSEPTTIPTSESTLVSTSEPTTEPTYPTSEPTTDPTSDVTSDPTSEPTYVPTSDPTSEPTTYPTSDPTSEESSSSTHATRPTSESTSEPTTVPTSEPTSVPTSEPTSAPTSDPTTYPTSDPTTYSTSQPTSHSTSIPVDTSSSSLPNPVQAYYASITDDMMGEELLEALRDLNDTKRQSTVGYSGMGTSMSGDYRYTDYDPDYVQYDYNGQPYGTKCISFYSGNSMTSWNREHVWPKSHGGNLVEDDIHMPRPTIPAENGSRGNSFYVEGMKDGTYGWDPAEEDFGDETYRGDSARIIFYCVVAADKLSLTELEYHQTSNSNRDNLMGKLSDMLSWNLRYKVMQREQNRNSGAQYLQGNRNPFIDHPEYACRIWGLTNESTRSICGM